MKIVALDPGETTGYAVYDTESRLVFSGEFFGCFRGCVDLARALGDIFIVENFRVRPHKGPALASLPRLWPVEWLGALRYCLPRALILQEPSQAKALKRPEEAASDHEADALRHLYVYLGRGMAKGEGLARALRTID